MKKIYASMLVLAMGTCITAGARTYQRANINFDGIAKRTVEMNGNLIKSDKTISKMAKVKANAGDEWNNLGQGMVIDGIWGTGEELTVTVEESVSNPGLYRIPDYFSSVSQSTAEFVVDATDPTNVMIPEIETGLVYPETTLQDGTVIGGPVTFFSHSYYYSIQGATSEEFKADNPDFIITFEDGIVNMPEGSILAQIGDAEYPVLWNDEMVLVMPGVEYVPTWGEIATGKMFDTFFEAGFKNYTAEEVDVLVQKCNAVEGAYRIIDPWYRLHGKTAPDPKANTYFVIDASDPDCVWIPAQSTGVGIESQGISFGVAYITSGLSFYETKEEFFASEDGEYNITLDTETNTINFPTGILTEQGNDYNISCLYVKFPNSQNADYYDPQYFYLWTLTANQNGYVKLPAFSGISSVGVDNNNAEAEYYNIQGVRVNNPVAGQLYIVKKGNEVSKQIMR